MKNKKNLPVKIWYHAGPYLTKKPLELIPNFILHKTFYKPVYNVGDQISPVIVSMMSERNTKYVYPRVKGKLVAVGSVLSVAKDHDIIWGSGLKFPHQATSLLGRQNIRICAVRGPLTRDALLTHGIDCPEVYGDPALLLSTLYPCEHKIGYQIGIFPHLAHLSDLIDHKRFHDAEIKIITPDTHWKKVITELCSCRVIYSTSLHGVIFAESYGIPAVLVRHKRHLANSTFKFEDYYLSTGRRFDFVESDFVFNNTNAHLVAFAEEGIRPQIDLSPLVDSFPYPVCNQAALGLLNQSNIEITKHHHP